MKLIILLAILPFIYTLNNGLARTPQMGWNSWNKFACNINEKLIKETADVFIIAGLKASGYQYINLDDCWQTSRDPNTQEIIADPQAFPSGMKSLAAYVHKLGLKFGLYSDAGEKTCQGRPGSLGFEQIDAKTYASWDVDYLKYDNCYNDGIDPRTRYPPMRDALNATGRPILYAICEQGQENPWEWAQDIGNSWRTTDDINDSWGSVLNILDQQVAIASIGQPGAWNDPDMLEVGNGGMTTTEYESHFALWAYLKAPLIIGCDVRTMSLDTHRILTNKEIIAVNQDPLGKPATRLAAEDGREIWGGPIFDGLAAILFNRGESSVNITLDFGLFNETGTMSVRDLYAHKELGLFENSFTAEVKPHGVVALKLYSVNKVLDFLGF